MTDRTEGRDDGQGARDGREGFGDDGGTRVGRPDAARGDGASRGPSSQPVSEGLEGGVFDGDGGERGATPSPRSDGGPTGAGAEAAEGTHSASQSRSPSTKSGAKAAAEQNADPSNDRHGSEPLAGRREEHESGYGGKMGEPRTSSDQRE